MHPLVLHNPLAGALFGLTLLVCRLAEVAISRASRGRARTRSSDWTYHVLNITVNASLLAAGFVAYLKAAPLPGGGWWPVLVGVALAWVGELFRLWAVRALGPLFTLTVTVQDDHRLIDYGPYRLIRHPGYLGLIVTLTGIGLAMGDLASTVIMLAASTVSLLVRIEVEERSLLEALGEEYGRYIDRTARLLPGIF